MLKTDDGSHWAHSSCAIWTPEISIGYFKNQEGGIGVGTEEKDELYCLCRMPYTGDRMIGCDFCGDWFHPECIGFSPEATEHYRCPNCGGAQPDENLRKKQKTDPLMAVEAIQGPAPSNTSDPGAKSEPDLIIASRHPTRGGIKDPVASTDEDAVAKVKSPGEGDGSVAEQNMNKYRKCHSCEELIGRNSKKCKHCGVSVSKASCNGTAKGSHSKRSVQLSDSPISAPSALKSQRKVPKEDVQAQQPITKRMSKPSKRPIIKEVENTEKDVGKPVGSRIACVSCGGVVDKNRELCVKCESSNQKAKKKRVGEAAKLLQSDATWSGIEHAPANKTAESTSSRNKRRASSRHCDLPPVHVIITKVPKSSCDKYPRSRNN